MILTDVLVLLLVTAAVVVDPGIDIDKGYIPYDRGIEQDIFLKVRKLCSSGFMLLKILCLYLKLVGQKRQHFCWSSVAWTCPLSRLLQSKNTVLLDTGGSLPT